MKLTYLFLISFLLISCGKETTDPQVLNYTYKVTVVPKATVIVKRSNELDYVARGVTIFVDEVEAKNEYIITTTSNEAHQVIVERDGAIVYHNNGKETYFKQ